MRFDCSRSHSCDLTLGQDPSSLTLPTRTMGSVAVGRELGYHVTLREPGVLSLLYERPTLSTLECFLHEGEPRKVLWDGTLQAHIWAIWLKYLWKLDYENHGQSSPGSPPKWIENFLAFLFKSHAFNDQKYHQNKIRKIKLKQISQHTWNFPQRKSEHHPSLPRLYRTWADPASVPLHPTLSFPLLSAQGEPVFPHHNLSVWITFFKRHMVLGWLQRFSQDQWAFSTCAIKGPIFLISSENWWVF